MPLLPLPALGTKPEGCLCLPHGVLLPVPTGEGAWSSQAQPEGTGEGGWGGEKGDSGFPPPHSKPPAWHSSSRVSSHLCQVRRVQSMRSVTHASGSGWEGQ